jgi:hypothetical protein
MLAHRPEPGRSVNLAVLIKSFTYLQFVFNPYFLLNLMDLTRGAGSAAKQQIKKNS